MTNADTELAEGARDGGDADALRAVAIRSVRIMADGTSEDFAAVIHPDAHNRESVNEPPACRSRGPAAFHATALWLRAAFSDLDWEITDSVTERDVVVLHTTLRGRHTGTFVGYDADGRPASAFPATGRTFAATQTHWCRIAEGRVIEHWANRDDRGLALQLGWAPPTPGYLVRMILATKAARRRG